MGDPRQLRNLEKMQISMTVHTPGHTGMMIYCGHGVTYVNVNPNISLLRSTEHATA